MPKLAGWVGIAILLSGCAVLPLSLSHDVHKLNSMEMDVLADVADLVQHCKTVQGFPLSAPGYPCPEGNVAMAAIELAQKIRVERMPGVFTCGWNGDAVGCWTADDHLLRYDSSGKIYAVEGVLEHEFLHALLGELDDSRHWCSLHDNNNNQIWDCYE